MARDNWPMIRLLLSDINVTYTEVAAMDTDEIFMLNAALDMEMERAEKEQKKELQNKKL